MRIMLVTKRGAMDAATDQSDNPLTGVLFLVSEIRQLTNYFVSTNSSRLPCFHVEHLLWVRTFPSRYPSNFTSNWNVYAWTRPQA